MRSKHTHRDRGSRASVARQVLIAAVAGVPLAAGGAARAVVNHYDYYTGTGEQSWFLPTGWTEGVPGAEDAVRVASSGTLDINSGAAAVNSLTFGYGDNLTPTLNLSAGGSLTSFNDISFGGTGAAAGSNNVLATLNQT